MIENETFEGEYFSSLEKNSYEDCVFRNCDFTKVSLAFFKFIDCEFQSCNMSNVSLNNTSFQACDFTDTKMVGVNFEQINPFLFGIKCHSSDLSLSFFARNDLKRSSFNNCKFSEAQLIELNAKGVDFSGSNFDSTIFDACDLTEANLTDVVNLSLDLNSNRVKNMKINSSSLAGILSSFQLDIVD